MHCCQLLSFCLISIDPRVRKKPTGDWRGEMFTWNGSGRNEFGGAIKGEYERIR